MCKEVHGRKRVPAPRKARGYLNRRAFLAPFRKHEEIGNRFENDRGQALGYRIVHQRMGLGLVIMRKCALAGCGVRPLGISVPDTIEPAMEARALTTPVANVVLRHP